MAFDWSEYLALADWLYQNAGSPALPCASESAHRSAVSRSYYTSFHAAMALLTRRGEYKAVATGEDHGAVIQKFLKDTLKRAPRIQIGTLLQRLKQRRTLADYHATASVNDAMADASVKDAKKILQYLSTQ